MPELVGKAQTGGTGEGKSSMGKASREAATPVPTWRHPQGDSFLRTRRQAAQLSCQFRPSGTSCALATSGVLGDSDRLLKVAWARVPQTVAQPTRRASPVLGFPALPLALGIAPAAGHSGISGGLSAPQPPVELPLLPVVVAAGCPLFLGRGNALPLRP